MVPYQKGSVDADAVAEPPIIQVREYSHSPTVSIVAWTPDEAAYGLRATLRRDGALVRDHRLYVSPYYVGYGLVVDRPLYVSPVSAGRYPRRRGFVRTVAPPLRQLEMTGILRDDYACYWGSCSPFERFEVRVPDALLRTNRDSVAIRLYGRGGSELNITVRRDLIDPYLGAVDSVTAALRKKWQEQRL